MSWFWGEEEDMWHDAHDAYLETRVMSADPLELVRLMYQACTAAVREARQQLACGDIAARSRAISKACEILIELSSSLDFERGGEISKRLAQLYDYIERRLIEANIQQSDAPLAEALGLLSTLAEAWDGLKTEAPAESPRWAPPVPAEPAPSYSTHAWSY